MRRSILWILLALLLSPIQATNRNDNSSSLYVSRFEYDNLKSELNKTKQALKQLTEIIGYTKSGVNLSMNDQLAYALAYYSGPIFIISSNYRRSNPRSKHYTGSAIDISTRLNFDELVKYLESSEGKNWLRTFDLGYQIENVSKYRFHRKYVYNKYATGPHIHLFVRRHSGYIRGLGHGTDI